MAAVGVSGIMAHSHQATESSTYGRPRLRYTVESRGPYPGPLPWRNTSSCPRRRGRCRWSIFAICQKTQRTDALRDAVARYRRRPGLPQVQLCGCVYLSVALGVQMQGLPPAVLGDQRNLARVPKVAGSDAADGFQLVRQRRQGHQQPSIEPLSRAACEDRVRLAAQAAMRFDGELRDDPFVRGR